MFAGAAAAAAYAVARPAGREVRADADRYRCPMHPDVDSSAPATCPICGMALVLDVAVHGAVPTTTAAPAPVVRVGRQSFSEAVRAPAWVDANGRVAAMVYRDDLVGLGPDVPAVLYPASAPSRGVDLALTADPPTDWDGATVHVHFRVVAAPATPETRDTPQPPDTALRPGEHGLVVIAARPHELQVVPASAVLQAAEGPYVLALDPVHRRLVPRMIQTGRTHHGFTAVLSGLSDGDSVVATGAFLVDIDARGASGPAGAP
jgi:multidrug efflux pump subunit AcrA (membrane-fusion protein)